MGFTSAPIIEILRDADQFDRLSLNAGATLDMLELEEMNMRLLAAIAAATIVFGTSARAQDFPTRPMTMVIPFAAGGPTDVLGRVIAGRMSEVLGQLPDNEATPQYLRSFVKSEIDKWAAPIKASGVSVD
jgi:hypothetical protein